MVRQVGSAVGKSGVRPASPQISSAVAPSPTGGQGTGAPATEGPRLSLSTDAEREKEPVAPARSSDRQAYTQQIKSLSLVRHRLTPEERRLRIRELAYRRAEQRDFAPGHDEEDWLEAEREVDAGRF